VSATGVDLILEVTPEARRDVICWIEIWFNPPAYSSLNHRHPSRLEVNW
jgi:hypothetical protein